jgi:Tfp pilus assembly protein PilO
MSEKIGYVLMVAGIIISALLYQPSSLAWQRWQQDRMTWEETRAKLAKVEELQQAKIDLTDQYSQVQNLLVPGETGVAAAAKALEEAAEASEVSLNLTFADFPEKVDVGGMYQVGLTVKAEIEGSYQAILNWAAAGERLPYLIRWGEMKLGQSRQEGKVKAEFSGVLFLQE